MSIIVGPDSVIVGPAKVGRPSVGVAKRQPVSICLSPAELAQLDARRLPGESRGAAARRLLAAS